MGNLEFLIDGTRAHPAYLLVALMVSAYHQHLMV
jgi:hypothetical protein